MANLTTSKMLSKVRMMQKKAKADHTSQDKSSNKSDKQNAKDGQPDQQAGMANLQR